MQTESLDFQLIRNAVGKQFLMMLAASPNTHLFRVDVDGDSLWRTYLSSFPDGTNPIFRERTEHDCSCCRSFIRTVGGIVTIVNNQKVSLWDCANFLPAEHPYVTVVETLAALVHSAPIANRFLHFEKRAGVDVNYERKEDAPVITWEHFYIDLPNDCVARNTDIGGRLGHYKADHDVFLRGMQELSLDAANTILDLMSQGSLYRGDEFKPAVVAFVNFKREFDLLPPEQRDLYAWSRCSQAGAVTRLRNTAIGTLLIDLSEGKELEQSVAAFERMVAPTNYRRPTALITPGMIEKAREAVRELGLESALERRFAVPTDLKVNNVIFVDRSTKAVMQGDVFDGLPTKPASAKAFDRIEEIPVDKFLSDVLPRANGIEVMVENRHAGNLVSLIAPVHEDAARLFKWDNPFSWSYAGELADSIKERVKAAGGKVDGDLRCSLSWHNYDDLDLHMREPGGNHIYYASKLSSKTQGHLDVDMNAGGGHSRTPVENICYPDRNRMTEGVYQLSVNQYSKRDHADNGFEVEIECDGQVYTFTHPKDLRSGSVVVANIEYSRRDGFKVDGKLTSAVASRKMWGIDTHQFHPVAMVLNSPNHWDGQAVGNKHLFFVINGCKADVPARGIFNEFLRPELDVHRKVFEVLGSKMKAEPTDTQLSGLGFSSTLRSSVICRIHGSAERVVKVLF